MICITEAVVTNISAEPVVSAAFKLLTMMLCKLWGSSGSLCRVWLEQRGLLGVSCLYHRGGDIYPRS